jgi:uncharacterized membrane protein
MIATMSHARVEMIVLGFPESKLTGKVVPALQDLIDRQLVRIIDLVFIEKDKDGKVSSMELSSVGSELKEAFEPILAEVTGWIADEDIEDLGDALDPGDSAAVLLFEHLWALAFTEAVRDSGGELLFSMQIPADTVNELTES